jgi:hypothetical protein
MTIALGWWARFPAGDGRRARWDHHLDAIAMPRDRLVGGRTIIGAISRYLANRIVNLIQQRCYLRPNFRTAFQNTAVKQGNRGLAAI